MITVMLSGTLTKQPETRTSAKGTSYTMATLKVQTPDGDLFATVFAFDPLACTLAELGKADSVTVVGSGKIGTYEPKDGSGTRASLSITASRIMALVDHHAPPRQRQHRPDGSRQTTGSQYRQTDERQYQPAGPREFADDIPF